MKKVDGLNHNFKYMFFFRYIKFILQCIKSFIIDNLHKYLYSGKNIIIVKIWITS